MRSPLPEPWLSRHEVEHVGRAITVYGGVGVLAGLAAVLFTVGLGWMTELLDAAPGMDAVGFRVPALGDLWLVALPAGGALLSGLLCYWLAPEAMGSGLGAVIEAYHGRRGAVRHRVPLVKGVASILTIGSGGSAGSEGPIGHVSGGIGAIISDRLRLPPAERRILLITGMAAGIGAVFHAPMAAALLGTEILYSRIDMEHEVLLPSIVSATLGYSTYGAILGWESVVAAPDVGFHSGAQLLPYAALAIALTLAAIAFIKIVHASASLLGDNQRLPLWLRPALGGLGVGIVGLFVPHAMGPGYAIIQTALEGNAGPWMMLLLALTKTVTSALTTGSGGSAGLFLPSLIVGAAVGGAVGQLAADLAPGLQIEPAAFAMVGMAGFLAAVQRAPLSAVIMVSELMGDYGLLVPSLWVCVIAWLATRRFQLYPEQLASRFDAPTQLADMMGAVLDRISVREAMDPMRPPLATALPSTPLSELVTLFATTVQTNIPILDVRTGLLRGVVDGQQLRRTLATEGMSSLVIASDFSAPALTVAPTDSLKKAMSRMTQSGYDELMVVAADDPGRLLGSLSRRELIAAYHRKMLASDPDAAPVRALDAAVETPAAEEDLVAALLRGGVVAPARGGTRDDVLRALVAGAAFPEDVDRDALAEALIAREQLGSTGVGHGIAIPHPHVADVAGFSEPTIVLGLTARPIDWGSLDGQPVTTVALLIVPPGHSRLEVLGRLARCLSDAGFQEALASRAPTPRIVAHLQVLQGQFR